MTVCAACCTPKAPPPHRRSVSFSDVAKIDVVEPAASKWPAVEHRRSVSFSDVETVDTIEPANKWPAGERRGMRVKIARDDVDWSKVPKRPDDNEPHVLGVALDYDGRAYAVRVLDAYTAWLPRYRFSVVSDS